MDVGGIVGQNGLLGEGMTGIFGFCALLMASLSVCLLPTIFVWALTL